jgi:serine/threonine protein kinase
VYVVLELATGGSLLDVIKRLGAFSERDAASAVRQIATAIGYLHDHGIVHRDIKMANVLVADRSSFVIKVSGTVIARPGEKSVIYERRDAPEERQYSCVACRRHRPIKRHIGRRDGCRDD